MPRLQESKLNPRKFGLSEFRIGKFRLFFSIDLQEKIVYITDLQLRKDAY